LLLHAMSEADREWVLQGLPSAQQDAVQPLLQELEELGIPREPDLAGAFAGSPGPDAVAGRLQLLGAAGVHRLASLLALEPPRLTAVLLAGGDWPWREQLLRELPPTAARQVQRLVPTAASAGRLQHAVVAELAQRLAEEAPHPGSHSLWQSVRRRFDAWRGAR
jgi:hypothetical protein